MAQLFGMYLSHFHQIHHCQSAINIEDTDGMSRHRLTPYNATISTDIHNEVSGSSSIDTYFLKQLVLLEVTQQSNKQFHLSTTLLLNVYFLTSNLQRSLYSL